MTTERVQENGDAGQTRAVHGCESQSKNFRMTKLIEMRNKKKKENIVTSSHQATTPVAAGEIEKVGRKVHFVV